MVSLVALGFSGLVLWLLAWGFLVRSTARILAYFGLYGCSGSISRLLSCTASMGAFRGYFLLVV